MMRKYASLTAVIVAMFATACTKSSQAPASPSTSTPADVSAAADGSTLKATAPTPQSPINNQQPTSLDVVLTLANASEKYGGSISTNYRLQVLN